MTNEHFIELMKRLKREGITYKAIALGSNVSVDSFYSYMYCNKFPYDIREQIYNYVNYKFKEIVEDE